MDHFETFLASIKHEPVEARMALVRDFLKANPGVAYSPAWATWIKEHQHLLVGFAGAPQATPADKPSLPDGNYTGAPTFAVEAHGQGGWHILMAVQQPDGTLLPLCFMPEGFRFEDEVMARRVRLALAMAFDPKQGSTRGDWFAAYLDDGAHMTNEINALREKVGHLEAANKKIHDDMQVEIKILADIAGVEPWTHKARYLSS